MKSLKIVKGIYPSAGNKLKPVMSSRSRPARSPPAVINRGRSVLPRNPRNITVPTAAAGMPAEITAIQATPDPNCPSSGPKGSDMDSDV